MGNGIGHSQERYCRRTVQTDPRNVLVRGFSHFCSRMILERREDILRCTVGFCGMKQEIFVVAREGDDEGAPPHLSPHRGQCVCVSSRLLS